jgi:hypothetical protein
LPEVSTFQPCCRSSEQRRFKLTGSFPIQRTELPRRRVTGTFLSPRDEEIPSAGTRLSMALISEAAAVRNDSNHPQSPSSLSRQGPEWSSH